MNFQPMIDLLRRQLPGLMAAYAFGSRLQGVADADSDLDMAVLVEGYADPLRLFTLAGSLSDLAACPVDLLDLRAASTVMQYQVITTGRCLWARDTQAALYETFILSEKTALDEARAGLLADIQKTGSVYGR